MITREELKEGGCYAFLEKDVAVVDVNDYFVDFIYFWSPSEVFTRTSVDYFCENAKKGEV